jgi:hypothetical protein
MNNLALMVEPSEARGLLEQVVSERRRRLPGHPDTLASMGSLAGILSQQGLFPAACRPGPQASSLDSGRPVKSAWPGAGTELAPGPRLRPVLAGARRAGTAKRATTAPAAGPPGAGTPGGGQRVCMLDEGSAMGNWSRVPPNSRLLKKPGFEGPFSLPPGKELLTGRTARL